MLGHHREQHLRRADVRRRLLAPDVLLARLQREPIARARPCASTVTPTRRPGSARLNSSRVAMNAACGPPKPIGTPKRCVEPTTTSAPHSPGGVEQRQREQVGRDDDERAARMQPRRRARDSRARRRRRPDTAAARANASAGAASRGRTDDDLDAERRGARAHDVERLRRTRRRRRRSACSSTVPTRWHSVIASAAAVASSSIDALAIAMPVRSQTIVWKLSSASRRPCEISGWYGV